MSQNTFYKLHWVKGLVLLGIVLFVVSCRQNESRTSDPWKQMAQIVDSITLPVFKGDTLSILDFGAVADGVYDNTDAFKKVMGACSEAGGGIVLVPKGKFLTGPIHLEDNVNLHLEAGSEILFSKNLDDYYPLVHTSYEGTELMNFSPLIYAYEKKNIAITGKGVLNGQAGNDFWWPWCGKDSYGWQEGDPKQHSSLKKLKEEMSEVDVPVNQRIFGKGEFLRPSFIEPFSCENVLVQGVKIINAPFWVIHPIKSINVTIDGVVVESHGPNNDGCDPEYSKNVLIKNAVFNTGDDCIAIKSGRNEDGRRVGIVSENIIVQNCRMIDGHGGVVMGSEISAGVRNIFVEDCIMDSPNLDRAIRIKTNTKRGGFVEDVYVRNIKVGEVKEAVLKINLFYGIYGAQEGDFIPRIQNINLENITVEDGGEYGVLAKGYKEVPIKDITLKNVTIKKVDSAYSVENVTNLNFINTIINGKLMKTLSD
ncbi:glycoside hydrolase family 28 protein [Maribacter sp. TH_r10]|uniref:Glycoside hydrolase family 28 protein n=1 Tax=Maribacter luteus TaxID=2594478 RepID=A0A6I2MKM6_9FLAO|nr:MULTISPECIES: glycoside hydrolase family 28 protein [Maribacter]MDV7138182.1 glycoside hydrolase family 28 protein [Maribacter sp. TH_r10]MRX62654.1 glycoside hydrolase family 28 protein [Maribacter luteus]